MASHHITKNVFVNTYSADSLPPGPRLDKPCAYVANTANWNEHGEHWVCFFFPKKGLPEYFDSFGLDVPLSFREFLGSNYLFKKNNSMIQSPFTSTCGQHVIYYIWQRCRGMTMEQILKLYCDSDFLLNDVVVNALVKQNFALNVEVIDIKFIETQLSM